MMAGGRRDRGRSVRDRGSRHGVKERASERKSGEREINERDKSAGAAGRAQGNTNSEGRSTGPAGPPRTKGDNDAVMA